MTKTGTLYLCATPIGNLEDITYRVVRLLREVSLIAAEDTRHTRKLLAHFDIHTPLTAYHEHNKQAKGPELIGRLLAGEDIALVSDAGMPGISDPGADLVRLALAAGVTVVPVPGPNAALTALVASGLDTTTFTFVGFLPKTNKKRREWLAALASLPHTLIFYEAPHRLIATLNELREFLGDRPAVAGRELTKKFEEFVRGTLTSLLAHYQSHEPRGEFTLIVAGAGESAPAAPQAAPAEVPLADAVAALVAAGRPKKEAIRAVAAERGLSRREVYQAVVAAEGK
ncbi:16S rRNA (cytidine(1402)-2'-O)-methyltransferase [Sporolituus thermophilus]|uniref:Ribosomal RNA small subunit methyltransferase I n=1 Tax=Sporolituus thermophilus DSM 23256 TaxID=1123285 RepID=A0A1G7HM91_9FIRM|nr:16S rRNA (cytidine(1402)-2'-O)-methyltransferase [Sporolituus thermophilus]SDF01582.1 16S rRNA (cytidine1402-2'-O)-methyltransferase [Sporolituus thermophilus DSM 23256]